MDKSSICVSHDHDPQRGLVRPIQTSTSYFYIDEDKQPYPRYFNTPNQESVATKIAKLEGAEAGLVFSSGMAAISGGIMPFVKPGDHVILLRGLYGGTHSFVTKEFAKWGIEYDFASADLSEFESLIRPNTRLIYVETPTNPCLGILDLKSLASLAKSKNILSVIDNTFATPINQNPIALGIDLVIHIGTKYLGGHSDLSCGAVVGGSEVINTVIANARNYGGTLNPASCHLLERSLKTLDVRVQRQNSNAMAVSHFLEAHDRACNVLYPGLASHPQHQLAAQQMSGFGGMIAFELADGFNVTDFLRALKLATPAMSLGGVESTLTIPALTSHKLMPEADRQVCGVTENMVRFSTGIESAQDLIDDLEQSLNSLQT
jgi:cystathionine beta-lyase